MTRSLSIRPATPTDAAAIREVYAPYVRETSISFEAEVPTIAEIEQRLRNTLAYYPWLVCIEADRVVGYAYGSVFNKRIAYQWSAETSVYIARTHHGRGIGRKLYTTLIALLHAQGFVNAYAGITMPNPASVALHEALGYRLVGTFAGVGFKYGIWHDVSWWSLAVSAQAGRCRPPVRFPALPAATVQAIIAGEST